MKQLNRVFCLAPLVAVAACGPPPSGVDATVDSQPPSATGCTVSFTDQKVDGASLWADIPDAENPTNCNFHRFAFNNFLYLVGGGDTPRFLTELASTDELKEKGTWPANPGFDTRDLHQTQAGDDFQLIDVAGNVVKYDIRINQAMWNTILDGGWNTQEGLAAAAMAYIQDPRTGGIWLPPRAAGTSEDSLEIKTSWRKFTVDSECPSDIMFCTTDSSGTIWGLLGMHMVQKTPTRGEWVWASFEHVSNSPDCGSTDPSQASSNPLQQFPRDPTNPTATVNVNVNSEGLANKTGWSVFDYTSYMENGGDGSKCDVLTGTVNSSFTGCDNPSGTAQCNGIPIDEASGTYISVNVCRTDAVPDHSTPQAVDQVCADTAGNANNVACITQSVVDAWPSGLDERWKYYMLVGTEWLDTTSVSDQGCFNITTAVPSNSFTCAQPDPAPPAPVTYPSFTTTGTTNLANTTMETWMQKTLCMPYVALQDEKQYVASTTDCFGCHEPGTGGSEGDLSHVFSAFNAP